MNGKQAVVAATCAALAGVAPILLSSGAELWKPVPLGDVRVGGVIGERIALTVTNNLMKLDLERDFIDQFRTKSGKKGFIGTGNVIEALVCLAKYTGDPDVLARKRRLVDAIIAAQEPGGYIGCMDKARRTWFAWDVEDVGFILDGLVLDWLHFGEKRSLEAAKRAGEDVLAQWRTTKPPKDYDALIYDKELLMGLGHGMWALFEATGDRRYADFVSETRGYATTDTPVVLGRGRGLEGHVAGYLDTCYTQLEMYRTRTDGRLVRQTNRFLEHYLRRDGGLVHGIEGICECFSGDQAGSGFAGETCMSAYALCTLDLALRTGACEPSLAGDVMERLLYNGFFAAQSRDGRKLRYYMPVSGVRPWWPTDDYCCPCNYRRIIGHLPEYVFYTSDRGVLANFFTAAEARLKLSGGTVRLVEETDYPTTGNVKFTVRPEKPFAFALSFRLPRWCANPSVRVNGAAMPSVRKGTVCVIDRTWSEGDVVEVVLPMPMRLVRGRQRQAGRCAILRGPLVYATNDRRLKMDHGNWAEGSGNDEATAADVITVEPKSLKLVTDDNSARTGGTAVRVRASLVPYQLGMDCGFASPVEIVFTEFADPENTLTYFRLPAKENEGVDDDELFSGCGSCVGECAR